MYICASYYETHTTNTLDLKMMDQELKFQISTLSTKPTSSDCCWLQEYHWEPSVGGACKNGWPITSVTLLFKSGFEIIPLSGNIPMLKCL